MRHTTAVALVLITFLAAGCRPLPAANPIPTPGPAPDLLRIGVTGSAARLVELIAEPAAQASGETNIQFVIANNNRLWLDLAAGQLDGILVHHIPPSNDNWFNPVALDGLVLINHPDNDVQQVTLAEAQALFSGRLSNWTSLGGPEQPVVLFSREAGAGARLEIEQRLLSEQPLDINAIVATSDDLLQTAVAAEPAALGYSMMGNSEAARVVAVDGWLPTPANTGDQTYPFTLPLYYVHRDPLEPQGAVRLFVAWLQSTAGQEIIGRRYGRVR